MKKESKKESKKKKAQILLRIEPEEKARLTELGQAAGFSSAAKFVIAAMARYGDILAKAILVEDAKAEEVRSQDRADMRKKLNLPADEQPPG